MKAPDQQFDPAEAARELGVTVKALRVYETRGLLKPLRSANGWRVYGSADIARVHEILALKGLGLSLKQIGDLLQNRGTNLGRALAAHAAGLKAKRRSIDKALTLVEAAQRQVLTGKTPTASDLAALARTMATSERPWAEELQAIYDSHLTKAERRKLRVHATFDWSPLIDELKRLSSEGADPGSPPALRLWRKWSAAGKAATGGDEKLGLRSHSAYRQALADPQLSPRLPVGKSEFEYLARLAKQAALRAPKRRLSSASSARRA